MGGPAYPGSPGGTGSRGYAGSPGGTGSRGYAGSPGGTGSRGYAGSPGYAGTPGYPAYPGGGRTAPRDGANGFAVAAFILAIFCVLILSIPFGIAALVRIRNQPQRGKGLAITGLILSGLWIVLLVGGGLLAVLASGSLSQGHRSTSTGQITAKGTVSISLLRTGDCFQNPSADQTLSSVTAVPCTTPHDAQIFTEFTATGASFPGNTALDKEASLGCPARVAGTVDKSKITDAMSLHYLIPQEQPWAEGHRAIVCFIVAPTSGLTSSLLVSHVTG